MLRIKTIQALIVWSFLPVGGGAAALRLEAKDAEPGRRRGPDAQAIEALQASVDAKPADRARRFALVRGLMAADRMPDALVAAKAWRGVDAYNLVVVRLIGDIHTELGDAVSARRTYSAVVELLPQDAQAQRALATVLKQAGDIEGAYERLKVATEARPEDVRLAFELADAAHRLGRGDEATRRFEQIIGRSGAASEVVYPAKQRLAQLLAASRRGLLDGGDVEGAERLAGRIAGLRVKGGAENDLKVYLTWDTDGSDVDLWVVNPAGQKVFYKQKRGKFGGELHHDVTTGYGPESFTATEARRGMYRIQVHYYDTNRSTFTEARGEVTVVLDEGRPGEVRHVLPYRLFEPKQTVTVAEVRVGEGPS